MEHLDLTFFNTHTRAASRGNSGDTSGQEIEVWKVENSKPKIPIGVQKSYCS